jgi:hypothetical protein
MEDTIKGFRHCGVTLIAVVVFIAPARAEVIQLLCEGDSQVVRGGEGIIEVDTVKKTLDGWPGMVIKMGSFEASHHTASSKGTVDHILTLDRRTGLFTYDTYVITSNGRTFDEMATAHRERSSMKPKF